MNKTCILVIMIEEVKDQLKITSDHNMVEVNIINNSQEVMVH